MTETSSSKLWDRNNPLFFYGNEQKLDDLLSRVYGEVVTQFQTAQKEGAKATLKFAAKFGAILALLGLGEASSELGAEISHEDAKTRISTLSFDNKLAALTTYCIREEPFPYIDTTRGLVLQRGVGLVADWTGRPIVESDRIDQIGQMLGLFTPRRVLPPHDASTNIALEFQEQKPHLWIFRSAPDSAVTAEVPVLLSNTRLTSQHALIAFAKFSADYFKIESVGLMTWQDGSVTCDPVAWRLFY